MMAIFGHFQPFSDQSCLLVVIVPKPPKNLFECLKNPKPQPPKKLFTCLKNFFICQKLSPGFQGRLPVNWYICTGNNPLVDLSTPLKQVSVHSFHPT
jgi:hypothetical protein